MAGPERVFRGVSLDDIPLAALACTLDGIVLSHNAAARRLAGRDLTGARLDELAPGAFHGWDARIAEARAGAQPTCETMLVTSSGQRAGRVVIARPTDDVVVVYVRDERTTLADAEGRLESLGLVAGGIAHDFNNLLVGILAESSAAREEPTLRDPTREALRRIEAAARRMAQLTRQLLAYSGRAQFTSAAVAVDELLAELREPLVRLVRSDLTLALVPGAPGAVVEADPGLLRQVVANLTSNASDAAHARVDVASRVVSRDGVPFWLLEVVDDGPGIETAMLSRIFEPFFSTKPGHHGLGLSAVYGIVRRLGGDIDVDTSVGRGARFRVHLPILAGVRPAPHRPPSEGSAPITKPKLAGIRALVADDEPSVRSTVRRLLERRGAVVVVAADGLEAEARLRDETFHLVVSDVAMPGASGYDVLAIARATQDAVRVVLMSGYTEKLRGEGGDDEPDIFIEKPFTAKALDAAIDQVLGHRR